MVMMLRWRRCEWRCEKRVRTTKKELEKQSRVRRPCWQLGPLLVAVAVVDVTGLLLVLLLKDEG
jgi:hypothetical protein